MKKVYKEQIFTFEDGSDMLIDVVVEDGNVTDIIAGEDSKGFQIGEQINIYGDESLIRSEDILVDFLK